MSQNSNKSKLIVLFTLSILSATLLGACGRTAPSAAPMPTAVMEREVVIADVEAEAAQGALPPEGIDPMAAGEPFSAVPRPQAQRMIIRTANLAVVVEDTETALAQVRDIATDFDGYLANTDLWRSDDQLRGQVTIRVPAESFDAAMDQIKAIAIKVERENVSGQDVTEEYTDLSARLRNLEATEKELLVLLTEVREKTRKAEDVLAVHRELTNIRGQIEQIKGRMQYLERMTALATINVELIPQEEEAPIIEEGWQPLRTLRSAFRSLIDAGQFLVDAIIWLVIFIVPVLLVLIAPLLILYLVWRRRRRRKVARQDAEATQAAETPETTEMTEE